MGIECLCRDNWMLQNLASEKRWNVVAEISCQIFKVWHYHSGISAIIRVLLCNIIAVLGVRLMTRANDTNSRQFLQTRHANCYPLRHHVLSSSWHSDLKWLVDVDGESMSACTRICEHWFGAELAGYLAHVKWIDILESDLVAVLVIMWSVGQRDGTPDNKRDKQQCFIRPDSIIVISSIIYYCWHGLLGILYLRQVTASRDLNWSGCDDTSNQSTCSPIEGNTMLPLTSTASLPLQLL